IERLRHFVSWPIARASVVRGGNPPRTSSDSSASTPGLSFTHWQSDFARLTSEEGACDVPLSACARVRARRHAAGTRSCHITPFTAAALTAVVASLSVYALGCGGGSRPAE